MSPNTSRNERERRRQVRKDVYLPEEQLRNVGLWPHHAKTSFGVFNMQILFSCSRVTEGVRLFRAPVLREELQKSYLFLGSQNRNHVELSFSRYLMSAERTSEFPSVYWFTLDSKILSGTKRQALK